jgi:hypothetical protein
MREVVMTESEAQDRERGYRLEAVAPDRTVWSDLFPGPIWLRAKDEATARMKASDRLAPHWRNSRITNCLLDEREAIPDDDIIAQDKQPLKRGAPGRWQRVTIEAGRVDEEMSARLIDLYRVQHAIGNRPLLYRGRNEKGDMEYLFTPEAIDRRFNRGIPTDRIDLPDLWRLEERGYSATEKIEGPFDAARILDSL